MTTRRTFVGAVSAAFVTPLTGCVHDQEAEAVPLSRATVHDDESFESGGVEYQVDGDIRTETMPSVQVELTATNQGEVAVEIPDDFVVVDEDDNVYSVAETSGFEDNRDLEPGRSEEYVMSYTIPADRLDREYYFGRDGDYVRLTR